MKFGKNDGRSGFRGFLSRYGFYAVMVVCVGVIAVTAAWSLGKDNTPILPPDGSQITQQPWFPINPTNTIGNGAQTTDDTDVNGNGQVTDKFVLVMPMENAQVKKSFNEGALLYSATLKQWQTHSGMDITNTSGDVLAAAAGKVVSATRDAFYGNTVVIEHTNKFRTVYSSLASLQVKAGDTVKSGQLIGKAGTTAVVEVEDGTHMHFEVLDATGNQVDPIKYLPANK